MAANHTLELEIQTLKHQLKEAEHHANVTAVATQLASDTALNTLNSANRRLDIVRKQRDELSDKHFAQQSQISDLENNLAFATARISELTQEPKLPEIGEVLIDQTASHWLVSSLDLALTRDPVDAANDAEFLAALLRRRSKEGK